MNNAKETIFANMKAKIAGLNSDQLLQGITLIGGGQVSQDQRPVRALMLDEYESRNGGEALDALMITLGMA